MRTLVTGITGFVGGHVADALLRQPGADVHGLSRSPQPSARVPVTVTDWSIEHLTEILAAVRPDRIIHLAGYANAGRSFDEPDAAWDANLGHTRRLYAAVERWGGKPRILFVSTGQVYGEVAGGRCDASLPMNPVSPYGASKAAADLISHMVTRTAGLAVVRVRPHNQIGPGQPDSYAVSSFARQFVAIAAGRAEPVLEVGDLSAARDFTDVRDMADAYCLLLERGRAGVAYDAGRGRAVPMSEIVETLSRLADVRVELRRKAERLRPADPGAIWADAAKLRDEIGWRPRYSLEDTLRDVLDHWRRVDHG